MRKTKIVKTVVAGEGGDGNTYGVHTMHSEGGPMTHRDKPCETCPWRKDSQVGRFPPDAYRASANVAYDMGQHTFACHESGAEKPAVCAGFLLVNAHHNMGVRIGVALGRIDLSKVHNPENVELYDSYKDMAVANGVPADDPALKPCRGNGYGPIPSGPSERSGDSEAD